MATATQGVVTPLRAMTYQTTPVTIDMAPAAKHEVESTSEVVGGVIAWVTGTGCGL